ncbi:MAG TPA: ABC transporter substrate-binding protein [Alphaproteobacteria bacterium]|nr:ABC transporter substrate-binding protein [Alphaproteobacteria bacterium]
MKRHLLAAGIGLAAALGLAASGEAKTLVYCSEGSPENFYPAINTTGTSFDASSRQIYNRLVEFKLGTTEVEPGLAQSWEVSPDGLTYTFHLRKGVKWQTTKDFKPTREFNADDVIFSFERQWKSDNPYFKVTSDNHSYFNDMDMPELLKSVEKVDDHTVRFVLKAPNAPFLANMAMDFASILSKEYADKLMKAGTPEKLDQDPVGTGPFQLESYKKDAVIRYKANPTYWQGKAKIDTLVFAITPDVSVRFAKIKSGECDLIPYPAPADIPAMKKDANLRVLEQPGLNIAYLAFNTTKKPFTDLKVRQAVDMAINKKAIIDAVYLGTGIPAKNPIPPSMWSYNDAVKDYPYDPAQAKKLLAEAGYANGFETDLWYMPVQRPYNPNGKRIAELMQADLAKVGIQAKLVTYEWGEYRKRLQAGDPMMAQFGWTGDNGDPDNFLNTLLGCAAAKPGGNNIARWCYKPFDDLVSEAQRTTDVKKRTELYKKAQVVFKEQTPWFTIAHSVQTAVERKKVEGFKLSPLGYHYFYTVDVK